MGTIAEKTGYERSYVLAEAISPPFVGVVYDATAGKVKLPTAEGQEIVGVIQAAGVAGDAVSVMSEGATRVAPASGATWAVGANLMVETGTGKFKEWTSGSSHVRVGRAEDALASGNTYGVMALRFGGEMDTATAVTIAGDITLENGEVISNATNGVIQLTTPAVNIKGGTSGGMLIQAVEATASITASASATIQANIPIGALMLGIQLRVDTALATGETWDVAWHDGSSVQAIGSAIAVAKNTKVNKYFAPASAQVADAETDIVITKNGGGSFTAQGVIRAIVYYLTFTAMADAA